MQQIQQNLLAPPIQFADRYQNGDFGLLPTEIWDIIYSMKTDIETHDTRKLNWYKQMVGSNQSRIRELKFNAITLNEMGFDMLEFNVLKNTIENTGEFDKYKVFKNLVLNLYQAEGYGIDDGVFLLKIINQKKPRLVNRERFHNILYRCFFELSCRTHELTDKCDLILKDMELIFGIKNWSKYLNNENKNKLIDYSKKITQVEKKMQRFIY
tara:strand:- start:209 stop:841 length:633 start_codon:yes stop_codon:yes gene_type:complete